MKNKYYNIRFFPEAIEPYAVMASESHVAGIISVHGTLREAVTARDKEKKS